MADYLFPEATATLVLDEPPFAGAEIETRLSLSGSIYFGTKQWLAQAAAAESSIEDTMVAARTLAEIFAQHGLLHWNLARPSGPVPADLEGLMSLDVRLLFRIVGVWVSSVGSVSIPLPETPPAGPAGSPTRPTTSRNGASAKAPSRPRRSRTPTADDSSASSTAIAPV